MPSFLLGGQAGGGGFSVSNAPSLALGECACCSTHVKLAFTSAPAAISNQAASLCWLKMAGYKAGTGSESILQAKPQLSAPSMPSHTTRSACTHNLLLPFPLATLAPVANSCRMASRSLEDSGGSLSHRAMSCCTSVWLAGAVIEPVAIDFRLIQLCTQAVQGLRCDVRRQGFGAWVSGVAFCSGLRLAE